MKLSKLWKITFGLTTDPLTLDAEQKVLRNFGFCFVKAATLQEAIKTCEWKMPIEAVECIGLIVEK